jgi:hypothetical protein
MDSYEQEFENLIMCKEVVEDIKLLSIPLKESYLQALWNHYAQTQLFETLQGETVEVLQSGHWNDEAGPDFLSAKVKIGGVLYDGDIELHLVASDWYAHNHEENPAYNSVILHVVWSESQISPNIPTLCLRNQISESHIQEIKRLDWMNYPDGLKYPPCALAPYLSLKSNDTLVSFFNAAGRLRFREKVNHFKELVMKWGKEEALWQGISEAMGYKNNQNAFVQLSQRVTWQKLKPLSQLEREAMLWGVSGFLPRGLQQDEVLDELKVYVKSLWNLWWKNQDQEEYTTSLAWSHRGRPQNSPERRLRLLSLLTKQFSELLEPTTQLSQLKKQLDFESQEWDKLYNFKKKMNRPVKLLGNSRRSELITNILLPYYAVVDKDREAIYRRAFLEYPKLATNHLIKEAVNRFLIPPARAKVVIRKNGTQQGLILLVKLLRDGFNFHSPSLIEKLLNAS